MTSPLFARRPPRLAVLALLSAPVLYAQAPRTAPLFPTPFVVEHRVVQTDAGGEEFRTEPVTDTYGGSWLVSVRGDESRTVVDFTRREVMQIDVKKGTYWALTFSRMRDLRERLLKAEAGSSGGQASKNASSGTVLGGKAASIHVEDVDDSRSRERMASPAGRGTPRHLRASSEGGQSADVWLDETIHLSKPATDALSAFEREALGVKADANEVTLSDLMSAVRERAGGAFPIRTRRPVSPAKGAAFGTIEDEVTRLEALPSFPEKLVTVPPGFRQVPSPLETIVAFEEEEAALRSVGTRR